MESAPALTWQSPRDPVVWRSFTQGAVRLESEAVVHVLLLADHLVGDDDHHGHEAAGPDDADDR
jgi:hypothetical protein